ncbi:hypothetical protein DYH09_17485 [bacterium CPR1]|nr:hypothetical protein [bacterium CPR1]
MTRQSKATDPVPYVQSWLGNAPSATQRPSDEELLQLIDAADREGVGGIVAEVLQRQFSLQPEWLRTRIYSWFLLGAEHSSVLERLGEQLADHGLEVVALKGAALAPTVYNRQLSHRPVSDLDLLVLPERESTVKSNGARATEGARAFIDWHRNLVDDERIPSKSGLLQLTPHEIWSLSRSFRPGIRHLEPELQFIHLSLHAFKHSCCRLIWLVDQALVLRTCNFERLLELARHVGSERPVLVSLHILKRLLGEELPTRQIARLRWHESLAVRLTCRRGHDLGWGELFLILSVPGLATKLRYLSEYLFPGPAVLGEEGRSNRLRASLKRAWRFLWNKNRTRG